MAGCCRARLSSVEDDPRFSNAAEVAMPLVIPDDALREAGLSERDALIEFACRLFESGRLGLWGAAKLAGLSRVAFEGELLVRHIPWLRPDEGDLADDLAAIERLGI
jgi:predicted HTH domain antitoxin